MSALIDAILVATVLIGQQSEVKTTKQVHMPASAIRVLESLAGTWQATALDDGAESGKAIWKTKWADGKPCLHCTQVWTDSRGTDAGAGMWGYDIARKQLVYSQFYVSGANATMRYDVEPETMETATSWMGTGTFVTDTGEAVKANVSISQRNTDSFVWKSTDNVTDSGQKLPNGEIHFRRVEPPK